MAINPRKIKKKVTPRPAKDLRSTDPKDLRNKALREANRAANERKVRPAKDLRSTDPKDLRNKALREANRIASERARGGKGPAPGRSLTTTNKPPVKTGSNTGGAKPKGTPKLKGSSPKLLSGPSTASKAVGIGGTIAKQFWSKAGGPATMLVAMTEPAGEGSTVPGQVQKALEKRFKREIRQGTELAKTGVKVGSYKNYGEKIGPKKSSSFGPRISEGAKFERLRASRAALGGAKTSASSSGTASLPKVKSSTATTAATVAAASSGGTSKAASVASASSSTTGKTTGKTTTVVKERVGLQSRYQRDALAMETRNKSGNKAKKSILSLFRKG